jgi:hypothetical protein
LEELLRPILPILLFIALVSTPADSQRGTGTMRGPFFDPLPIGAAWTMKDALTGYITNFHVAALTPQTSYSCFTPAYSSMMVDLHIAKTTSVAYPNPGVTNNEDLYIYKSAAWGQFVFMETTEDMATFVPVATTYFFQQFANPPYGMLLRSDSSDWGSQQDAGQTNDCHTPPATFTNTWTTVISQQTRTTPVYSGPVNCAAYDSISTTQNQEVWCFANNPRFPPILVELDTIIQGGSSTTIKLQTTQISKF